MAVLPHNDQLLALQASNGDIVTTEGHLYWNAGNREWQEGQDLGSGESLLTLDGDEVTIDGLDWSTLHVDAAYGLTVADLHTFYFTVGGDSSHNLHQESWLYTLF